MRSPLSQRFKHLLYNKPAKVENNLESFQTLFMLDAKVLNKILIDSLTFNLYDVCPRFVKCEANSIASTEA